VPENTYIELIDECQHAQDWANGNGMVINLHKTKEIVLHRPHRSRWSLPQSLEGIEQVLSAKLLGVIFRCTFSLVDHVDYILKLEIHSVERGICPIDKSTMTKLFLQLWRDALRMHETAIFPLRLLNLTSSSFFSTPISFKNPEFRRFSHK